jgi:hypothetical protein
MRIRGLPFAALLLALSACSEPKTIAVECVIDDNCPTGMLCEGGTCVSRDSMGCDKVVGGAAVLEVRPYVVNFGAVEGATTQKLTLRNIGNCTLMVFGSKLEKGATSPFACPGCSDQPFELFRDREKTVEVSFTPKDVGTYDDFVIFESDDAEFPKFKVPLHASFEGVPKLYADPNPVDFGYQAQGGQREQGVRLANIGSGVRKFVITKVSLNQTGDNFALKSPPTSTVELDPIGVDPKAGLDLTVDYHPRDVADHTAELVIEANPATWTMKIPVKGTSKTPPVIHVSPTTIDFGSVAIGSTSAGVPITISNSGGTDLVVTPSFTQVTSPDFSVAPPAFTPIKPGEYLQVQAFVAPSFKGSIKGNLILNANDPMTPQITIPLAAIGFQPPEAAVLKVELNYDNGSDGLFDSDLRKVDLGLENTFGFPCDRQHANPTTWGSFGTPTWLAIGPKEEPQRVLVLFDKTQLAQDTEYSAMVQYTEDCSMLPSGLLAGVLGISVEALVAYMSSGAVIVNGMNVADMIAKSCFDHSSTNATVTLSLNSTVVAQRSVNLGKKGDFQYLKIKMVGGTGGGLPTFSFK